jgi:integration host factor subunit beta
LVANDTEVAVKAILKGIFDVLKQGRHIEIRGIGSFNLSYRKPRVGRDPRSGVKISVPAKYAPHFKAGLDLKLRLAENKKRLSILKSDN